MKETIANVNISSTKGVFRYPGSKNRSGAEIVSYFPKHDIFLDVFGGSAAITLRKEKSRVEIYNEINSEIVNLFQVFVYQFDEFEKKAQFIINSREWFNQIRSGEIEAENNIDRAINTYYLLKFGFNGRRSSWPLSIKSNSKPGVNIEFLRKAKDRLSNVQFSNYDYEVAINKIIDKKDDHKILFYLDPPYPVVGTDLYGTTFDTERFENFLEKIKEPWILSYPMKLSGYYFVEIEIDYALKERKKVTEYLMSNFPLVKRSKISKLEGFF